MPDPIPRNKSARGWRPRRPAARRAWPGLPFRRPPENVGRHRPQPGQPRPSARQESPLGQLFRWPQGHVGRHRLLPPSSRLQPSTGVVVGVLLLVVAVLVVWIVVLPLLPSATFSGSMAAPPTPPASDHADAVGGNDPGTVDSRPEVPAAIDPGPTHDSAGRDALSVTHRDSGVPVAGSQPRSVAQPSQPNSPAAVADLGQQGGPAATDQVQRQVVRPSGSGAAEPAPRRKPQPPPVHPRGNSGSETVPEPPEPELPDPDELRDQFSAVARKLAEFRPDPDGTFPQAPARGAATH